MSLITCLKQCSHQKEGLCVLDIVTSPTGKDSECPYLSTPAGQMSSRQPDTHGNLGVCATSTPPSVTVN